MFIGQAAASAVSVVIVGRLTLGAVGLIVKRTSGFVKISREGMMRRVTIKELK